MKTFVFYGMFFKPMPLGYNLKSVTWLTSEPSSTFVESIIPSIPILTILTFSKSLNGSISLMFGRHYNNSSCGTEQGPGPPENPNWPGRVWVDLRIIGSDFGSYFRVIFGFGSVSGRASGQIKILVWTRFFLLNQTLLCCLLWFSLRLPQLSASLRASVITV